MRHRLTFEGRTSTADPAGGNVLGWSEVCTVWGSIAPVTGRELNAQNSILAEAETRIRVRWSPTIDVITPKNRITHDGNIYDILRVIHVRMEKQMVEFLCKSGASAG